ncbi:MAG: SGNH/GDSL hydrolase family protein [Clostridiales bacterium]|nr:SGNH/GDSL hydrolase family protein [Clostridiales bacterium]
MQYFDKYVSDTVASTGNQSWFELGGKTKKGRIFYRIESSGTYEYSLLFSSIIDSTFSDGSHSVVNTDILNWTIKNIAVAITCDCNPYIENDRFIRLTFDKKHEKVVNVSGFFSTDGVKLEANKGEYLCVDIEFCGDKIPYHEECVLVPVFSQNANDEWVEDRQMPVPCMVGCDKKYKARITFWGDSITQGIGTELNSYSHYASIVASLLGDDYACYNVGLGFGRANDGAMLKSWFYRAKQCEVAVVCFGVNDIFRIKNVEQTKSDIKTIVTALKNEGVKVILQTVPPFDYNEQDRKSWESINSYIKNELKNIVDEVFDCVPILGVENMPYKAKYGGHPNSEGCKAWGEKLYVTVEKVLKSLGR